MKTQKCAHLVMPVLSRRTERYGRYLNAQIMDRESRTFFPGRIYSENEASSSLVLIPWIYFPLFSIEVKLTFSIEIKLTFSIEIKLIFSCEKASTRWAHKKSIR